MSDSPQRSQTPSGSLRPATKDAVSQREGTGGHDTDPTKGPTYPKKQD